MTIRYKNVDKENGKKWTRKLNAVYEQGLSLPKTRLNLAHSRVLGRLEKRHYSSSSFLSIYTMITCV